MFYQNAGQCAHVTRFKGSGRINGHICQAGRICLFAPTALVDGHLHMANVGRPRVLQLLTSAVTSKGCSDVADDRGGDHPAVSHTQGMCIGQPSCTDLGREVRYSECMGMHPLRSPKCLMQRTPCHHEGGCIDSLTHTRHFLTRNTGVTPVPLDCVTSHRLHARNKTFRMIIVSSAFRASG